MNGKKLYFVGVLILLIGAVFLAGCGAEPEPTEAPPTAETKEDAPPPTEAVAAEDELKCEGYGEGGKCRVVLVNSFLGNDYRIQMQRAAEAASKHEPYASAIDFEILNTENTPEAQRAGLENLIAEGVDAILLNAVDNTSVNDIVEKACEEGVEVITFDITARPGACEHAVEFAFYDWAYDAGAWLGLAAGIQDGPINVIMDKGLQGVAIADDIYQGGLDGMKASGGDGAEINIVGEYYGEFAEGVQEPLVSAILAANPDQKIDVVFTQGYCTTIASAFENAGLDYLPIMYCQGYNSNQILCAEDDADCFINAANFSGSIGSLDAAYRIFKGETVPDEIGWPVDYVITQDLDWEPTYEDAQVVMAEVGVTAFPDLPPGFSPAFNWPGAEVQITVEEAAGLDEAPAPAEPDAAAGPNCEGYGEDGKCRVVLVNSFLGNDYRIQMQRAAEAASKHEPYASAIDFEILNTENTPEAQRAGLENLIAEGVDAILLNAVDNTSVNDIVEKACEEGVEVITFDITARPGACEHAVEFAFYDWAYDAGAWLGLAAGIQDGPINVIMDKGLQGVAIADDIYQGGLDGMKAAGGDGAEINIVGEYYGEFAEGVQEPLVSAILAANPDQKIDVVFTQGYCTTIASAFENAGLDYLPIMYCQGYNSNQILCAEDDADCFINAANFSGSIGSLDAAYHIFMGETVPDEIGWPVDYVITQDLDWEPTYEDAQVVMAEVGVTAFPELPPGFSPAFNWPGAEVQITVEEAAGLDEAPAPAEPDAAAAPECEGYGADGKCRVVLVNSFLGNDYRIQMQRAAEAASKHEPYASAIDFEILNTENTPEAQRAGLENLIAEGVDAILLNAVDNTSVNDIVEKACEEGVEVITFDITARPGACEHAVEFAFYDWAYDAGAWLGLAAGVDEGPINVIMDKGLQGVAIADDIYQGGLDGMAAAGGDGAEINIVGEYYGEFAEGVQEPLVSAILAANPDQKIDVVFTQGYCTTIASAFENAGLDYLPIMYCQGYNSNQILCAGDDVDCFINAANFSGSIGSLDAAYSIFTGETVPDEIGWPVDYVVTQDLDWEPTYEDAQVVMAEVGVTAFPDLPPGFSPAFNWPGAKVQITVEEAAGLE